MKKIFFLIIIVIFFESCINFIDHVYFINFNNNSSDSILISWQIKDTTIPENEPYLLLAPQKSITRIESKKKWDDILLENELIIFLYNKDTINHYTWDILKDNEKIIKRFKLTRNDLQNTNWIIEYP